MRMLIQTRHGIDQLTGDGPGNHDHHLPNPNGISLIVTEHEHLAGNIKVEEYSDLPRTQGLPDHPSPTHAPRRCMVSPLRTRRTILTDSGFQARPRRVAGRIVIVSSSPMIPRCWPER
jgi:hypothetical protein